MAIDFVTLGLAEGYTDDSISGIGGTLAGKNCTIASITDITGGHRVTFQWTADDSTTKTQTMDVMDGSGAEAIEQIYADNGILGAKNLLKNVATSQTINSVTYTVNSDKSVTVNGTGTNPSAGVKELNQHFTLPAGNYILSGSPHNVFSETGFRLQIYNWTDSTAVVTCDTDEDAHFAIGENKDIAVRIWFQETPSTGGSNITFYPMLRLASDTDSTYQPYAMTNAELTDAVAKSSITATGDIVATNNYANIRKVGNMVICSFYAGGLSVTADTWATIGNITVHPRDITNFVAVIVNSDKAVEGQLDANTGDVKIRHNATGTIAIRGEIVYAI